MSMFKNAASFNNDINVRAFAAVFERTHLDCGFAVLYDNRGGILETPSYHLHVHQRQSSAMNSNVVYIILWLISESVT